MIEGERSDGADGQYAKQHDLERARERPDGQYLTTNQGLRIADNQNSLRAGARGPSLLEDFILREKITHFDHERIPERVVHARGSGAHGYFQVYESLADVTAATFLQDPARRTPVFVRFSTVAGSRGSMDTARDVRGFATKFYTDEGIFDLVGNNIPVFFIQDAIKFPDVVHAVKPEPDSEIPQAASAHDTFWDFIWLTPESTHMIVWIMSDRAIPRSYRMMDGFGVNTYRFVNDAGASHLVKFHWRALLGAHSLVWDEAQKLGGKDSDFHRRDLWEAIDQKAYPEYEFAVQLIPEADQLTFEFDPLDPTKVWPEAQVPLRRVGRMVLNRNPDNFFAETEQVAFHVGHMVPGIDVSNDPLLQGRLFSYLDTQLIRLGGPNFAELPINRPTAPVHNNQRDGSMRHTINTAKTSYQPNSLGGGCPFQAGAMRGGFESFPERIEAHKVRERSASFRDHFSQATLFWRSQAPHEQDHIVLALQFELGKVMTLHVRERMVDLLAQVDLTLARRVAAGIGVALGDGDDDGAQAEALARLREGWEKFGVTSMPGAARPSPVRQAPELSMANTIKDTVQSRKVAILCANGVDGDHVAAMKQALLDAGAAPELVSPLPTFTATDGIQMKADKTLLTVASVLYDAVYVPGGAESAATLATNGDVVHFVQEAYKHLKALAATGEGVDVLLATSFAPRSGNGKRASAKAEADRFASLGSVFAEREPKDVGLLAQSFIAAIAQHRDYGRRLTEQVPA